MEELNLNEALPGSAEQSQPVEAPQVSAQEDRYQRKNFRDLRDAADKAARERDEALRRAKELEEQLQRQQNPYYRAQAEEQPEPNFSDDELVDGKTVKRMLGRIEKKFEDNERKHAMTAQQLADYELRRDFEGIDDVVTTDNIKRLQIEEPHLAQSIMSNPDRYSAGASAYRAITRLGIATYASDKQRAMENIQRPRPVSSISPVASESPLTKGSQYAPGLSRQQKEDKYQRMLSAMNNR